MQWRSKKGKNGKLIRFPVRPKTAHKRAMHKAQIQKAKMPNVSGQRQKTSAGIDPATGDFNRVIWFDDFKVKTIIAGSGKDWTDPKSGKVLGKYGGTEKNPMIYVSYTGEDDATSMHFAEETGAIPFPDVEWITGNYFSQSIDKWENQIADMTDKETAKVVVSYLVKDVDDYIGRK